MDVYLTIDTEHDCPPFANSDRGIREGMPKLLELLRLRGAIATFFTTGDIVRRFPGVIESIMADGHEIGCHGDLHRRFDKMTESEAASEIRAATETLRKIYPVLSFRAPYLKFPRKFMKILADEGYKIDSSLAKHKNPFAKLHRLDGITRVPVSTTSIVLRAPRPIRNIFLKKLKSPVVLFFHPWEFVDLRREPLRFDCRYNTGEGALKALDETIDFYKNHSAVFLKMESFKT